MPTSENPKLMPHALMSAASWFSALMDNVMSQDFTLECRDERATLACAAKFAQAVNDAMQAGLVIYLQGDLGAEIGRAHV